VLTADCPLWQDVLAPILVLLLAWALGDVVGEAKAADFLSRSLHSSLPKWSLPALISIVSGLLSFAYAIRCLALPLVDDHGGPPHLPVPVRFRLQCPSRIERIHE
jgi:hypothetical protein